MRPLKYRKLPVEIEAFQFTEDSAEEVFYWISVDVTLNYDIFDRPETISFDTMDGKIRAKLTDYVIKGVHGEFYPCDAEVFLKTYEEVI